ncbi:hypothetical protein J6590_018179 [Homalodisca vitripennis]|nr:hypothetical protein J6590_018179 [Homalodisca vitripennis]
MYKMSCYYLLSSPSEIISADRSNPLEISQEAGDKVRAVTRESASSDKDRMMRPNGDRYSQTNKTTSATTETLAMMARAFPVSDTVRAQSRPQLSFYLEIGERR